MEALYIDSEFTNHFSHNRDNSGEIIEFSAFAYADEQVVSEFSEVCKPLSQRWSLDAEKVHRIKKEVAYAQQHPQVMFTRFIEWLESMGDRFWTVVTHNGKSDNNYLMRYLMDYNLLSRFQNLCRPVWEDTYDIAKAKKDYLQTNNLKLSTLVEYFGWKIEAHNSLEDAKGTCFVHQKLKEIDLPNKNRENLSSLAAMTKKEKIKAFMNNGYIQYGKEGCIYISEKATANKMAMETILTELWDKYCI